MVFLISAALHSVSLIFTTILSHKITKYSHQLTVPESPVALRLQLPAASRVLPSSSGLLLFRVRSLYMARLLFRARIRVQTGLFTKNSLPPKTSLLKTRRPRVKPRTPLLVKTRVLITRPPLISARPRHLFQIAPLIQPLQLQPS